MSIDSVKAITTVKASDLPDHFDIRVGSREYPMIFEDTDGTFVYVYSIATDETINIPVDQMVTILIPDTWDNAALDISLDLMSKGII